MSEETSLRLQNFLAQRGVASRRGAAALIEAGRVKVNGVVVTTPGARIEATDIVALDNETIKVRAEEHHTYLYNKPIGEVSSTDGQGARSVLESFKKLPYRLVPVGRLDKDSEGLLLISNDGSLIHRLTHPRYDHSKTYEVDVHRPPTEEQLRILRSPLKIEGYRIRPVKVTVIEGARLRFILKEGRHRQIRQMCEQADLKVRRLKRVAIGTLTLGKLKPGAFRELTAAELQHLLSSSTNAF
ncbi:MAG: pseudouridine synthase [bacterium]|nr:pseudouridine synthase [bacterium]